MTPEQIRKLPVGPVLDLLKAGVYMEIAIFRVRADTHPDMPYLYADRFDGKQWMAQSYFNATIDGVSLMLISFADQLEADNGK